MEIRTFAMVPYLFSHVPLKVYQFIPSLPKFCFGRPKTCFVIRLVMCFVIRLVICFVIRLVICFVIRLVICSIICPVLCSVIYLVICSVICLVICFVIYLVIAWRPAPSFACSAYLYILAQTIFIQLSPSNMSRFYNFTCFAFR